ncbi:hypothetical protein [Anderseniella sp. Alg231-50]|uniref:hypothetical protein n=1 Tax=Anderseniella sp. Alg231-50 TaxID=1922226 RepID=UPI00307BF1FC
MDREDCLTVKVTLILNGIRFLAYNYRYIANLDEFEICELLERRSSVREAIEGITFNKNDNHLREQAARAAHNADWPSVMLSYMEAVAELLQDEFAYDDGSPVLELLWDGWTLRQLEAVWEFRCRKAGEALRTARDVSNAMLDATPGAQVKSERTPDGRKSQIGIAPLNANRKLVCYAKSEDRVRLELRFSKNIRRGLGDRARIAQYPNDGLEALSQFIELLQGAAAEKTSVYLRQLPMDRVGVEPSSELLGLLIAKIAQHTSGNVAYLHHVIRPLIADGQLETDTNMNDGRINLRRPIEGLIEGGVIRRLRTQSRERRHVYVLTNKYRSLIAKIDDAMPDKY